MNYPRFSRAALPILSLLLFPFTFRGQDIAPPDLWDIATGEQIPAAEVLKTKDFGAIVLSSDSPGRIRIFRRKFAAVIVTADQGGPAAQDIQPKDIILGVDGMRTYGWREYELARLRNPLATDMTLLVNRNGDLQWVKLHNLQPGRDIQIQSDDESEQDRFLNAIETMGVDVTDDNTRASLNMLPARAAAELELWSAANKSPGRDDTAWIQDFIGLYSAVKNRHYSDASTPAHEPPIPYFQQLEKFYLGLAAANQPKEVPPDYKKSGETPEFYILALPVPDYRPPLGDLKFSDKRFQVLLGRKYAQGSRDDSEIATAAQKYASSGANGLDQYLDQIKAAILDPDNYGRLPYQSSLVGSSLSRQLLDQGLDDRMKDENAPDRSLDQFAKTVLAFMSISNGPSDQVGALFESLGKQSPYLARNAADGLFIIRHFWRTKETRLDPIRKVLADNGNFLGPNAPELYRWALEKVAPVAIGAGEFSTNSLQDPYSFLTGASYAELTVLKGAAPAKPDTQN